MTGKRIQLLQDVAWWLTEPLRSPVGVTGKRWTPPCKTMEEYGDRLQYSVFICDLSRSELVHARAAVEKKMKLTEDSVAIVDLGETTSARFTFIGKRRPLPTNDTKIV